MSSCTIRSAPLPTLLLVVLMLLAPSPSSAATAALSTCAFIASSTADAPTSPSSSSKATTSRCLRRCGPRGAAAESSGGGEVNIVATDTTTSTTSTTTTSTFINGIRDVADRYDVFLLDLWGVLLDGTRPYDGVLKALEQLRHHNKRLVVLSNSSKRRNHSIQMLTKLGFDVGCFETIITSGELAHQMLSGTGEWLEYCQPWGPLARDGTSDENNDRPIRRAFCLGSGDGDAEYLRSCGWELSGVDSADLIVARGTFTVDDGTEANRVHKRDDPARYEAALTEQLRQAALRRIPMLVCNPDKVRPDRDRPPMPGQLGDLYESMLGGGPAAEAIVKRVGKPDPDVYAIALQRRRTRLDGEPPLTPTIRACMVGDALETDVTGGSGAGIDALWVLETGIHGPDLARCSGIDRSDKEGAAQSVLDEFNAKPGTYAKGRMLTPTLLMPSFRW